MNLSSSFWEDESRKLAAVLRPRLESLYLLGVKIAQTQLAITFSTELTNTLAVAWAKNYLDTLLSQLMETTISGTGKIISEWIDSPTATMGDLHQRLMQDQNFSRDRASRIAVTETTRAIAQGEMEYYLNNGIDTWQWNTNNDEFTDLDGRKRGTCEVCASLNGKQVKIGEPFGFNKKGEPIIKPPDAHIGDRCWVTPVVIVKKPKE